MTTSFRPLALALAALTTSLSVPLTAQADTATTEAPASAWTLVGNAGLVSNYLFRGISVTQGHPAAQINAEFDHSSGLYVGGFGSGVSNAAYPNGSGTEIDVFAGWRQGFATDWTADVGVYSYWFPGARYQASSTRSVRFDTQELRLGLSRGSLTAAVWYGLNRYWSGLAVDPSTGELRSTQGSTYAELNWNPELATGWTLNLHAGREMVRHMQVYNFNDYKAGVTYTMGNWQLAGAWNRNTGRASVNGTSVWSFADADGSVRQGSGSRWTVSAMRGF